MKSLYLCRHAKSSWKYPVSDYFRPLNGRGLKQAALMAESFTDVIPNIIYCSPAARAYETALAYFEIQGWDIQRLVLKESLYEASLNSLLTDIKQCPDSAKSIMLFGHNPGLNDLAGFLVPSLKRHNLITSTRVEITLQIECWNELAQYCGSCNSIITPKNLADF